MSKRNIRLKDITGKQFNRLLVVKLFGRSKEGSALWKCKCICGTKIIALGTDLRAGHTQSCGCLKQENNRLQGFRIGKAKLKHGHTSKLDPVTGKKKYTKVYNTWARIIARCENKNTPCYKYYGAHKITICKRWRHSFESFLEDMGEPPSAKHSIDRIDNSKGYSKANCKWSTHTEQMRNRSNTLKISYLQKTKSLPEWAELLNIPYDTLYSRLYCLGWAVKEAFTK